MRIGDPLQHLISVFYVFVKVLYPRVENIGKTVLSKIAIR